MQHVLKFLSYFIFIICFSPILTGIHDDALRLPIQIKVYGWQNELREWYIYSRLAVNVGLTDIDFDRNNPAYQFKRE